VVCWALYSQSLAEYLKKLVKIRYLILCNILYRIIFLIAIG